MTTTTGAAATKPRSTKTTAKATDTTAGASPMAPEPMARWHGEAMLAELRKPLYAYIGAGEAARDSDGVAADLGDALRRGHQVAGGYERGDGAAAGAPQRGEAASHPDRRGNSPSRPTSCAPSSR